MNSCDKDLATAVQLWIRFNILTIKWTRRIHSLPFPVVRKNYYEIEIAKKHLDNAIAAIRAHKAWKRLYFLAMYRILCIQKLYAIKLRKQGELEMQTANKEPNSVDSKADQFLAKIPCLTQSVM